ncbi:hypothetical protein [Streptomyces sp. NPDC060035]
MTSEHAGLRVRGWTGPTVRRTADLYPGESRTDARDAFTLRVHRAGHARP